MPTDKERIEFMETQLKKEKAKSWYFDHGPHVCWDRPAPKSRLFPRFATLREVLDAAMEKEKQ